MTEENVRRGPLGRDEAQRWLLQEYANRAPSQKEMEVRRALARQTSTEWTEADDEALRRATARTMEDGYGEH
ncbi:hypothetical protein [Microbacterium imperiale]|uniref:Uncharacterized protein n=1 Tax=Microbacterium imperiale TaxID=33884 RepID=A0A9W6M3G3_9MICO|nr:hypothetical protein [Microbacterium imperiale]MBP2422067.1 hypothetical protein [Microbacterium imperiale]MDS0200224.1 hypothetical protein [Microbacterium imperiale]BFE39376.1 hypothetical protein GCM10017544_03320 [Microbacterium imperiale]GLJ79757.1 hypothetical protein GCM10017586_14390 [Microbacterium imperiale]